MEGAGQRAQSQLCSVSPEAHAQRNILRYLHRVLIIQKFAKRVDLTLSSYLTHTHTQTRGREDTLGGDGCGCVYGTDGGAGFRDVHLPPNSLNTYSFLEVNHTSKKW